VIREPSGATIANQRHHAKPNWTSAKTYLTGRIRCGLMKWADRKYPVGMQMDDLGSTNSRRANDKG